MARFKDIPKVSEFIVSTTKITVLVNGYRIIHRTNESILDVARVAVETLREAISRADDSFEIETIMKFRGFVGKTEITKW